MSNDVEENSPLAAKTQEKPVEGRRRFLRGTSLALPAVMTLHVQSVTATSVGTFHQCTENGADEIIDGGGVTTTEDGYQREPVLCYQYDGEDTELQDISPIFFDNVASVVRSIAQDGAEVTLDLGVNIDDEDDFAELDANHWSPCEPSEMYALIRFDADTGEITSLGVGGTHVNIAGIAMSAGGACWHSIMGTA